MIKMGMAAAYDLKVLLGTLAILAGMLTAFCKFDGRWSSSGGTGTSPVPSLGG